MKKSVTALLSDAELSSLLSGIKKCRFPMEALAWAIGIKGATLRYRIRAKVRQWPAGEYSRLIKAVAHLKMKEWKSTAP